jgi:hypothetical protein
VFFGIGQQAPKPPLYFEGLGVGYGMAGPDHRQITRLSAMASSLIIALVACLIGWSLRFPSYGVTISALAGFWIAFFWLSTKPKGL